MNELYSKYLYTKITKFNSQYISDMQGKSKLFFCIWSGFSHKYLLDTTMLLGRYVSVCAGGATSNEISKNLQT